MEYKNSALYKEIVSNAKVADADKKVKKEAKLNTSNTYSNEIAELRKEVVVLGKDVKEMLRLMNALYDFESQ